MSITPCHMCRESIDTDYDEEKSFTTVDENFICAVCRESHYSRCSGCEAYDLNLLMKEYEEELVCSRCQEVNEIQQTLATELYYDC